MASNVSACIRGPLALVSPALRALALTTVLASQALASEPKQAELASALPRFAPRASALWLVCSPATSTALSARTAKGRPSELESVGTVYAPQGSGGQYLRLHFGAGPLTAYLGTRNGQSYEWGTPFPYDVQSDAPEDYVAIKAGSGQIGMLQTLVVNRVAGAAILTLAVASLGAERQPRVSSTFYVCEPESGR
jgi:hypothetical protein